jgi:hypothetical protein
MCLFTDGHLAGTFVDKMDFVQIAYTGSNGMTGGTLLPSPIMKMQIGIPPERTL